MNPTTQGAVRRPIPLAHWQNAPDSVALTVKWREDGIGKVKDSAKPAKAVRFGAPAQDTSWSATRTEFLRSLVSEVGRPIADQAAARTGQGKDWVYVDLPLSSGEAKAMSDAALVLRAEARDLEATMGPERFIGQPAAVPLGSQESFVLGVELTAGGITPVQIPASQAASRHAVWATESAPWPAVRVSHENLLQAQGKALEHFGQYRDLLAERGAGDGLLKSALSVIDGVMKGIKNFEVRYKSLQYIYDFGNTFGVDSAAVAQHDLDWKQRLEGSDLARR